MTKYFSKDTPLASLERMMMSVPGFQKRGGGMMVLCRFHYKKEDVDCAYCQSYMRHTCQASVCPYIPERLEAGTVSYQELAEGCLHMAGHQKLWNRLSSLPKGKSLPLVLEPAHRRRLSEWLEAGIATSCPHELAAAYLLSSRAGLWRRVLPHISHGRIDFSSISLRGIDPRDYSKHIAGKEDWEMVDIYADEGISGLEARNRDDFNRMMADCREGKIDRVLCKSISRFARNTQEYIQFVRELLRLGISIHFEKENIDTGKMTSEQVAQIYGAFAQMESTNHSSNMRFSVRMRMEKGLFVPSSVPYGYRLAGRDLEIIPEEAEVVRRIFSAYLSGQGKDDIARELNQIGVDRGRNREKWHPSTVAYILTNITYTGDMIWQKSCATDTIPFRQVRNLGQKPRYFVEHSHPAIVSCADFQRVQELMSSRKEQFQRAHCTKKGSLYDKHIYCGECGSLCRKKITGGKTYWVCRRHDGDRANCPIPQIPEPEITAAVLRLYHKLKFGQETVLRPALSQLQELRERELRSNRKISDIDNEIARISEQNLVLVRLKSKGYVDSALYLSQMDEIDHKLRELRKLRRRLLEAAGEDRQIHDTERMMEYLEDGPEWLDEVPSDLFGELLDRIIIISPERLKFRLLNGMELSENIERMVR